jgi:hypothetical protein
MSSTSNRTAVIEYIYHAMKAFENHHKGHLTDDQLEQRLEEDVDSNEEIHRVFETVFDENDIAMVEAYLAYQADLISNGYVTAAPSKYDIDMFISTTVAAKFK